MYEEVNTKTNLPAQIDLFSIPGNQYKFMFMAKGGGSANKSYLFQETKALLTPGIFPYSLFLVPSFTRTIDAFH